MDPATCRGFPHPGSRLPLTACGSSGGGRVPEEEWEILLPLKVQQHPDLAPGLAPGYMELACFAGHPPAQDSLAFTPRLVGRERGDLPHHPAPCERIPLAASYAAGEKSRTGTLDRIDLCFRIWEDVSSLKDFFCFEALLGGAWASSP